MAETTENCRYCRGEDFYLKQSRASFAYSEPLESVIQRFKYDGLFALARPLGKLMVQKWPEWAQPLDVIVPIPLHPQRQRSRGFNQAQLLAHHLGPSVGIEINDRVLRRMRYTKPQIGLSPLKRKENVWEAFAANPAGVRGKNILLLDDVFTTGATTTSAANTLLEAGAKSVSAYCLARAVQ
jgi:ComF family protein